MYIKKNNKDIPADQEKNELTYCPNTIGAWSAYSVEDHSLHSGPIRCNSWGCPFCGPIKKKGLFARFFKGALGSMDFGLYGLKHLTMTCPGREFRESMGYDVTAVYDIMADNFAKLIRNLRRHYGEFHYFRVCELQRDGMPHFHVLLAGQTIAPKQILDDITYYWRDVYGMGYVRLNCIQFKDKAHALSYMLKYITKDHKSAGKHKRIFTASQGALQSIQRMKFDFVKVQMGSVGPIRGIEKVNLTDDDLWGLTSGFWSEPRNGALHKDIDTVIDSLLKIRLHQQLTHT